MRIKKSVFAILLLTITAFCGKSQTIFQYPVAPDTCTTLESRCDYIIQRFWDNCDFTKTFANDSAYLSTMQDYFEIMQNANRQVGLASIRNLMFKAQANHSNFTKLMNYAEFLLFLRPTGMIDDVYITFANAAAEASWLSKDAKKYYKDQIARISTSKMGEEMSNFAFNDAKLNSYLNAGVIKLVSIDVSGKGDVKSDEAKYPTWAHGSFKDALSTLDIRMLPAVFMLDADHKIMRKNIDIDELINMFN